MPGDFDLWYERLSKIFVNLMGDQIDETVDWQSMHDDGYRPIEAFEQWHFDLYGQTWEDVNGRNGVGS